MSTTTYDCIIVGAGYAGLSAARELTAQGLKVLVLEARDRVGGRAKTVPAVIPQTQAEPEVSGSQTSPTVETVSHAASGCNGDGTADADGSRPKDPAVSEEAKKQTEGSGGGQEHYWDCGASFIGPGQDRMYSLAKAYGVETFPAPTRGKIVYIDRRGKRSLYEGLIPPLRPWELLDCAQALWRFERLCRTTDADRPWLTPGASELDSTTATEWFRRSTWTRAARDMARLGFEAFWGVEPAMVSALHAAFACRAGLGFESLASVKGGAQQDMLVGGGQEVANRIAAALTSDVVRLGEAVLAVKYREGGGADTPRKVAAEGDGDGGDPAPAAEAELTTAKGVTYKACRVILAVPPPLLQKIAFDPALPTQKQHLIQHMPMGAYTKVMATYPTRFWADNGLRGESTRLRGYISITFDMTSPSPGSPAKLLGFVVAARAREFLSLGPEERRMVCLREFAEVVGEDALAPTDFVAHTMMDEEWSLGCPLATPTPGTWTTLGEWVRRPIGPLHWAGTETATVFYGYMEGAVRSGERAAKEVREGLSGKPP